MLWCYWLNWIYSGHDIHLPPSTTSNLWEYCQFKIKKFKDCYVGTSHQTDYSPTAAASVATVTILHSQRTAQAMKVAWHPFKRNTMLRLAICCPLSSGNSNTDGRLDQSWNKLLVLSFHELDVIQSFKFQRRRWAKIKVSTTCCVSCHALCMVYSKPLENSKLEL